MLSSLWQLCALLAWILSFLIGRQRFCSFIFSSEHLLMMAPDSLYDLSKASVCSQSCHF